MKVLNAIIAAALLSGGILLAAGCSSSPSEEEMNQLRLLQSQVKSLRDQIGEKEKSKTDLTKKMADKDAKLKQCQSDQEAVKKAMGK